MILASGARGPGFNSRNSPSSSAPEKVVCSWRAHLVSAQEQAHYIARWMGLPCRANLTKASHSAASRRGRTMVPRGLEPRTLRLLAVRSNQLSYETHGDRWKRHFRDASCGRLLRAGACLRRTEVICRSASPPGCWQNPQGPRVLLTSSRVVRRQNGLGESRRQPKACLELWHLIGLVGVVVHISLRLLRIQRKL
jgi:hypothetical protein